MHGILAFEQESSLLALRPGMTVDSESASKKTAV
jgi:hypothetical protein